MLHVHGAQVILLQCHALPVSMCYLCKAGNSPRVSAVYLDFITNIHNSNFLLKLAIHMEQARNIHTHPTCLSISQSWLYIINWWLCSYFSELGWEVKGQHVQPLADFALRYSDNSAVFWKCLLCLQCLGCPVLSTSRKACLLFIGCLGSNTPLELLHFQRFHTLTVHNETNTYNSTICQ